MSVSPRVNQLSIDADAIAGSARCPFQHMGDAECPPDFPQIARSAFELLHGGTANHFQVRYLGQARENVVVHSGREIFVLFVVAQIFERKNGNAFLRNIPHPSAHDVRRQNLVAFVGAPDSLWGNVEHPRQDQRDWKS